MAKCVVLEADGTLTLTGQPVTECSGEVLVSGSEYGVIALVGTAFEPPSTETIALVSAAAFFAPLVFYLVGLMVGKVAGFFDRD